MKNEKFTRKQAVILVAGVILWFLMLLTCYVMGLVAHNSGHAL